MKHPFILLDRDGVINYDSDEYIKSPDEWHAIPGSLDAIAQLNRAGFRVFVVTNQSGLARGLYDLQALSDIHEKFIGELTEVGGYIEEIFFCPHHPRDHCACRKPHLGLFHQIQKKYQNDLSDAFFIGDSFSDIQAAINLPCKPLLVLTGKGQHTLDHHPDVFKNVPYKNNLDEAVQYVLES